MLGHVPSRNTNQIRACVSLVLIYMSRDTGYEAEGASVVGKLWSSMFGRVVTDRQPPTDPSGAEKSVMEEPALGMKLTGDPHPLDRLVSVQPNTVVVVFEQDSAPRLKLRANTSRPGCFPRCAQSKLAVNTAPVELDVIVDHLMTLDGHEIERCLVRVTVQLTDRDKYASVAGLAGRVRDRAGELPAAAGRNRGGDGDARRRQDEPACRPTSPNSATGDGRTLVAQDLRKRTLVRRDFAVIEVTWPKDSAIRRSSSAQLTTDRTRASTVKPAPAAPLAAKTPAAFVTELTMDAGLRRIWRRYAEPSCEPSPAPRSAIRQPLRADREPGAYEGSRLREAFGVYLEDRHVHFVAAVQIPMRIWFAPGSSRSTAVPGDWYRSARLMTTRSCGSGRSCPAIGRESARDCRLAPNRIEKPYGGWFPMSGSSSWRRTRRADPMSVSGTPS